MPGTNLQNFYKSVLVLPVYKKFVMLVIVSFADRFMNDKYFKKHTLN